MRWLLLADLLYFGSESMGPNVGRCFIFVFFVRPGSQRKEALVWGFPQLHGMRNLDLEPPAEDP